MSEAPRNEGGSRSLERLVDPLSLKDRLRYWGYRRKYGLHRSFRFNGDGILFTGGGEIEAGERSYIGRGSIISTVDGTKVKIGKDCMISHYVLFYTSSLYAKDYAKGIKTQKTGDIVIGDGVWIGAGAYIGPGVSLPEFTIIPANAVVTKYPPQTRAE